LRILQKAAGAVEHPAIGSPRADIGKDTRMLAEGNNIYYVSTKDGILITAVVHSRRLPANWL
jgi:plasmid stabilization system protein ParE